MCTLHACVRHVIGFAFAKHIPKSRKTDFVFLIHCRLLNTYVGISDIAHTVTASYSHARAVHFNDVADIITLLLLADQSRRRCVYYNNGRGNRRDRAYNWNGERLARLNRNRELFFVHL